jgi:hypothetical protein
VPIIRGEKAPLGGAAAGALVGEVPICWRYLKDQLAPTGRSSAVSEAAIDLHGRSLATRGRRGCRAGKRFPMEPVEGGE